MNPRRVLIAAAAGAALLAGCGPAPQLKLGLRTVSVTVPRVITPVLQMLPPSAPVAAPLPPITPVLNQLPPAEPLPAPSAQPAGTPKPSCPQAPPLAVPARPASETVNAPPVNQQFLQRGAGSYTTATRKGTLDATIQVTITDAPSTVTSTGQKVEGWRVQQYDPRTKTRSVEVYQLLLPSTSPLATSPGVYLVGLAWSDPIRGTLSFQPSGNGLYVLPTPVQVASNAAQYAGIATDPNSLTTLQLTRNVHARKRIDACGQLVDTWTVAMTGVLTSPQAQWNVTWNQQIATAYGAVDVDELFALATADGVTSWTRRLLSTTVPKGVS